MSSIKPKLKKEKKRFAKYGLSELRTPEEIMVKKGRYFQPEVGVVYAHKGLYENSIRIGKTEKHYNEREKDTDKREYECTKPIVLLLTDNVLAVEYALRCALNCNPSHCFKNESETYEDFYQRVVNAFYAYDLFCKRGFTAYFSRLVSLGHLDDWRDDDYLLENADYLYLSNIDYRQHQQDVDDTDYHVGLEEYYTSDDNHKYGEHYTPFLKIPSHMRFKAHKRKQTAWVGDEGTLRQVLLEQITIRDKLSQSTQLRS